MRQRDTTSCVTLHMVIPHGWTPCTPTQGGRVPHQGVGLLGCHMATSNATEAGSGGP